MQEIARRILEYLADNPDANDTSEGITQWWLLEREIRDRQAEVERSLSDLVSEGLVIANRSAGARTRYRLNPDRAEEIEKLFKRRPE
jgi:predicted transcriptional regulator